MSLQIVEKKNDKLSLHNSKNNLDQTLANDIPEPLPDYSGFSMLICGASGSGKTTALYSIMSAKKKNGTRQSYRKRKKYKKIEKMESIVSSYLTMWVLNSANHKQ